MDIHTGWLSPPLAIGGIDHLGTQSPCQLVYAQLVPGITNVTDRARYYSLYPWLIWSFDQRHPEANREEFITVFRRADFLLTVVAERHGRELGEPDYLHGAAMPGRTQLAAAMADLADNGSIDLDKFATREAIRTRYFKQALGGLGQYYVGTLAELRLLDTKLGTWVRYSDELGAPLARAVDAVVPSDRFWDVLTVGKVGADDLDALAGFCPCGLHAGTQEYELLSTLFFADSEHFESAGEQRRLSLVLLLHLAQALSGFDARLDVATFRGAVYSGHLPGRNAWRLPASLEPTRARWAIYQLNELVSLAFLSFFASTLNLLAEGQASGGASFPAIEMLAGYVAKGALGDAVEKSCGTLLFGDFLAKLTRSAPPIGNWMHADHEQQVAERLLGTARQGQTNSTLATHAFQLIGLLAIRTDDRRPAYNGIALMRDDLQRYPINLESFRMRLTGWRRCSVRDVLHDIAQWCLTTHLSVALRKLRETGRSTFRFRLGDRGVEIVDETPLPTRTTPRFNQSLQVLIDLGALRPAGGDRHEAVVVTDVGQAWLARHGG